ncbi:MAG: TonB-dependent receptor [Bacteroidia bacterium]|nr:TonB-dependent receptor [Bacteroidia bacterium]
MKALFTMLLLVAAILDCFSQTGIYGKVTDENGIPLPGANVIIEKTFLGVSTNADGIFNLPRLKDGNYTLTVSFLGYTKESKTVVLKGSARVDFTLKHSDILTDEIEVSAIRAGNKVPGAYTNIDKENIEKQNLGQDIPFLLNLTPSLVTTSDAGAGVGYTGFRIRGTDLTRINVSVNGIPLNDAESHGVWWVDLPDIASSVEDAQIQRGVGTSTNGAGAFGASMNLRTFTQKNNEPYTEITSSYGSFNTSKNGISLGTGLIDNKFSFNAHLASISSDGYIDRASSSLSSWFLNGNYSNGSNYLKLNIFSGNQKTYQAWNGVPSDTLSTHRTYNGMGQYTDSYGVTRYYDNETDNYEQTHYQLIYSREITENLNANIALHYTHGDGYYEEYRNQDDFSSYGLDPIHIGDTVLVIGNHSFIFPDSTIHTTNLVRRKYLDNDFYGMTYALNYRLTGLDLTLGGAYNDYEGRNYGTIIWAQFSGMSDINYQWYHSTGSKKDFNIFGKLNWSMTNKLNLYGDVQYRYIDYIIKGTDSDLREIGQTHTFDFLNPKFGLFYDLNENTNINFMFGVANREPNRDNYTGANPSKSSPVNETLYDYELSAQYKTAGFTAGANLYYMYYYNQLILTGEINDVGEAVMVNTPESYRAGIEFNLGLKLTGKLKWNANLTLSRNKIRHFTEYVDNWDTGGQQVNYLGTTDIAFSPDVTGGSELAYNPVKGFDISLMTKYVGDQYIDNTSGSDRMLKAYIDNSIRLSYSLKIHHIKEISFNLLLNNVLNARYETNAWVYRYMSAGTYEKEDGYFPQAGRNFLAGISLKF